MVGAFPYVDWRRRKNRPAVVVQNDTDNQRLTNTIIAMISGNMRSVAEPTQLLVDPAAPEGASSGLFGQSAVRCSNLFTVRQQDIERIIGQLSDALVDELDACLKAALAVA